MARKSFSIHSDFYDEIAGLKSSQRSALLLALIKWSTDSESLELDSECSLLFRLMTAQIVRISEANAKNRLGKTKEKYDLRN